MELCYLQRFFRAFRGQTSAQVMDEALIFTPRTDSESKEIRRKSGIVPTITKENTFILKVLP